MRYEVWSRIGDTKWSKSIPLSTRKSAREVVRILKDLDKNVEVRIKKRD